MQEIFRRHQDGSSCAASGAIYLRSAATEDLPAITQCCTAAFTVFSVFGPSWNSDAALLPAILKALPGVDIRVAVNSLDGSIIGVAVWIPRTVRIAGRQVEASVLAPLAVVPDWQRCGVGSLLMRDGIAMLQKKQTRVLFILGHESYYPRFGLRTGCYGRHACSILAPHPLNEDPPGYRVRSLLQGDERACLLLWHRFCAETEGVFRMDTGLLPWMSKTRGVIACVLLRDEKFVGYARFDMRTHLDSANGILRFLAEDEDAAMVLAGRIRAWAGWSGERLGLPLSAHASAVQTLFSSADLQRDEQYWPPAMAMALNDRDLDLLLQRIQRQELPPLMLEWPVLFDY